MVNFALEWRVQSLELVDAVTKWAQRCLQIEVLYITEEYVYTRIFVYIASTWQVWERVAIW